MDQSPTNRGVQATKLTLWVCQLRRAGWPKAGATGDSAYAAAMSKAFLPEDATVPDAPILPARPARPLPITAAGHARLSAERAAIVPSDDAARLRLAVLDRVLATVEVRPAVRVDGGAGFGCRVALDGPAGPTRYVLVGPDEVMVAEGRISIESPVARALLGARVGDEVDLRGRTFTVTAVDADG